MRVHVLAGALALATFAAAPSAQQPADTREAHCAAARAAAGTEYLALYNRFAEICSPANEPQRGRGAGTGAREVPGRETSYSRPQRCSTTSTSSAPRLTAHGRSRRPTASSSSMRCSTTP